MISALPAACTFEVEKITIRSESKRHLSTSFTNCSILSSAGYWDENPESDLLWR